jgi:hypothetical protein
MEAVAAFGLAANILPFIDFASKFVSILWNIHFTGRDGVEELTDLCKIAQDLHNVLQILHVDDGGDGMEQIVGECQKLGSELERSLEKLNLPEKVRKRDALKTAVKIVWKVDELKAIQTRLDMFRSQLTLNLLASLR